MNLSLLQDLSPHKSRAKTPNKVWRLASIFSDTWYEVKAGIQEGRCEGQLTQSIVHTRMNAWSEKVLSTLRVNLRIIGEPCTDQAVMMVGNHISYMDIPILVSSTPVAFIAKKQIAKWPVIGQAAKFIGCALVDRDSKGVSSGDGEQIADCILNRHQSLALFPSGTTCLEEKTPWRWGAFKIAQKHHLLVQPFRLQYSPAAVVAFLGDSALVPHLWRLLDEKEIVATVTFHSPVYITDPEQDAERWRSWSRGEP